MDGGGRTIEAMHERPHGLTLTNLVCFDGTLAELLGVTTKAPANEHTADDLAEHEAGRGGNCKASTPEPCNAEGRMGSHSRRSVSR